MKEVYVRFSDSEVSGLVPVGTYLVDCIARFGFRSVARCSLHEGEHHCKFVVISGKDLLSEPTETEKSFLGNACEEELLRLGCQSFLVEAGEVEIKLESEAEVEVEKSKTEDMKSSSENYREVFAKLPLEKKIADLVHLEAVTFNETINYVINSPYTLFDKILDVFSELGLRKESEEKAASRPIEHRTAPRKSSSDAVKGKKARRKAKAEENGSKDL